MPVDPNIPLAFNYKPIDVGELYGAAVKLKEMKEQYQESNALRAILRDPQSLGPDGKPTANALVRMQEIGPQGWEMAGKVRQQQSLDEERQSQAEARKSETAKRLADFAHQELEPSTAAYQEAIREGLSKDAALAIAQREYTKGREAMAASGLYDTAKMAEFPTQFDPIATTAAVVGIKDYLAEQREARAEAKAAQDKLTPFADAKGDIYSFDPTSTPEHPGGVWYDAKGKRMTQAPQGVSKVGSAGAGANAKPNMTPEAIDLIADQVLAGDKSALANIGRGVQGAADLAAIRNAVAAKARAKGLSGQDVADIDAEYFGQKAGETFLGRRGAQLSQAGRALDQAIGQSQAAYAKLPRGDFVPFNKLEKMVAEGTSSPEQYAAYTADQFVINAWARAINPTGQLTVEAQKRGEAMLSGAVSVEAHDAILGQMRKEIEAESASVPGARSDVRRGAGPEGGLKVGPDGVIPVSSKEEYDKLKSGNWYRKPGDPPGTHRVKP